MQSQLASLSGVGAMNSRQANKLDGILWVIKSFLLFVAAFFIYAWYQAPSELSLQTAVVVDGQVERKERPYSVRKGARNPLFELKDASRSYFGPCERALILCEVAAAAPVSARVWILESSFRRDDWVVQAQINGQTILSIDQQNLRYRPYLRGLQRRALIALAVAMVALVIVRRW
jgi:hypothetical protein